MLLGPEGEAGHGRPHSLPTLPESPLVLPLTLGQAFDRIDRTMKKFSLFDSSSKTLSGDELRPPSPPKKRYVKVLTPRTSECATLGTRVATRVIPDDEILLE